MTVKIDEQTLKNFEKEGIDYQTSFAFAHLFSWLNDETKLESPFRERFEEIGLVTPEDKLVMDDIDDDIEWLLLANIYNGDVRREWSDKEKCFLYTTTQQGSLKASEIIKNSD